MKSKLALLLPIRCISFIIIFLCIHSITNKEYSNLTNCWSVVCSIVNIVLILILILVTKLNKSNYFELINYGKKKTRIKDVVIMCIIVLFVGMGVMWLSGLIFYQKFPYLPSEIISPLPIWVSIIVFLILPLSTALAEEGLYLGCGVNSIDNKYLKIAIPSLFFALQHSFIPFIPDIKFMSYRFLSFLPLTIILCIIYDKKKNPLPIIIAHTLIDLFTVIWILIASINPEIYNQLLSM